MIEHKHWKRKSTQGIQGQHIAIVGYSHYYKEGDEDSSEFTRSVMKSYISGDPKMGAKFFPPIQSYFGYAAEEKAEFWNRVHFFNFIPESFPGKEKFASGKGDLINRSQARFKRILSLEKPDKVFVFSRKGWNQCPDTEEQTKSLRNNGRDTWGYYDLGKHRVMACGLRHPLYAPSQSAMRSVQEFLAM